MYAQPQMAQPQQFMAPQQQYAPQQHAAPQYGMQPPPHMGAPQQFGAPLQQYGAPPQQFGAPPHQYGAPPQHFGAPHQFAAAPQVMHQPAHSAPMPQAPMQTMPAMPQPMLQADTRGPPQVVPGGTVRAYTPQGGEMLQITVMGTRGIPGASNSTVHIQVPGKHDFELETQVITGMVLQPKTTVTYIQPGDGLVFTVQEQGQNLGAAEMTSRDFYPGGFEGDLPIGGGALAVKITPLGASGQIQQLPPVSVQQPRVAPVQVGANVVVGSSGMRLCSPEEFQHHGAQPGAQPVFQMTPEEMHAQGLQPQQLMQQAMMQPQHMIAQQPMPMHR